MTSFKPYSLKLRTIISFLILPVVCASQATGFECDCDKVGLKRAWADSNNINCYLVPVPRNKANNSSGNFKLAVVIAPALKKSSNDPMLYLHGGPGIATLENVPKYLKSPAWDHIRQDRPLVFFDYRGTGASEPELCPFIQDSIAAYSASLRSAEEGQSRKITLYRDCRIQLLSSGIDVSTFNSSQLASDAEMIRQKLKIGNWSVYGVSFGTTVGLNLLRSHGKHVSAMILDSPFPPNAPWVDFVRPFDTCFRFLEQKIASNPSTFSRFPDIRKDFRNAVNRLNEKPVAIKPPGSEVEFPFAGNDFAWTIWSAMLKPSAIPMVPIVMEEVAKGNDSLLVKWVMAFSNPNAFGKFSELQSKAILCFEGKPKSSDDTKDALERNYPDFTAFNIDFESQLCDAWQPVSAKKEAFEPVKSNVPVLILSGEFDPVCPPIFGAITARTLPNSTFITVPAASHAAIHVDECMREIAAGFLSNPKRKINVGCVLKRTEIKFLKENPEAAISQLAN